jgi:hypothetical protein
VPARGGGWASVELSDAGGRVEGVVLRMLDGDLGVGDPKNITADWGHAKKEWKEAMSQFAFVWPERFEVRAR